jgi:hypothetical protein
VKGADAFVGLDIHGEPYSGRRGAMITEMAREVGVAASLFGASELNLDNANAARLGRFLLKAAGVDIVGAARKVVEADARADTLARRLALDALAAELAKLEGGT